jgi:hypothetical protein
VQFPATEYTEECMRVSIEFVRRFNEFEAMDYKVKALEEALRKLNDR